MIERVELRERGLPDLQPLGRIVLAIPLLVLLSGCSLFSASKQPAAAIYDFGSDLELPTTVESLKEPVVLDRVSAAPAISGIELRYRYDNDPTRLWSYTEARWSAPPAVLLERGLAQILGRSPVEPTEPDAPPRGYRLTLVLERFEQVVTGSTARVEARARAELIETGIRGRVVARETFEGESATSFDSHGAAVGLGGLAEQLTSDLIGWVVREVSSAETRGS